ncbi:hypothetical protein [Massilia eurypsychrophila]|uniref:hypothetical protein n=1 Tax=Massilia eurypsychrophila TaxID=1485217 RepID=UPI0027D7893E|nr:hypothetical protein [Massilia eurypsychrophila]
MNVVVNLDVDDLDAAIAFYIAAFGLEVGRRLGPTVAELLGGPAPIYLLEKPAGTRAAGHAAQLSAPLDAGASRCRRRRHRQLRCSKP